jgi:hypothetical protein
VRAQLTSDNRLCPAWLLTRNGIAVQHIRSFAELDKRDAFGADGVVEELTDEDIRNAKRRATVAS